MSTKKKPTPADPCADCPAPLHDGCPRHACGMNLMVVREHYTTVEPVKKKVSKRKGGIKG
jgi:hypothetical protein